MLGVLLWAGCLSHRDTTRNNSSDVGVDILATASPHNAPLYYTARFTCSTQGITATGQLRLQPDSILWVSASKVIELGRACFTKDSVVVYAKVMGRCFRGSYDDIYRRFHYRTTFEDVVKMMTATDAEQQIATLVRPFNIEVEIRLDPWQQVEKLRFPLPIPANVNPL